MKPIFRHPYLQLHTAVFLFGFTAILGKLISISGYALVWYRLIIVSIVFALYPGLLRKTRQIPRRDMLRLAGVGVIVALHWVTFYESIKYANASVTLACLATTTLFVSFIEPLVQRTRVKPAEIIIALAAIVGIGFIFQVRDVSMTTGLVIGLISAALTATFGSLNKKIVMESGYETMSITQIELGAGLIFITLLMPVYLYFFPEKAAIPVGMDWGYIVVLAVLCTNVAYSFSMNALKTVSAYNAALAVNLEPVYGIAMAYFLFDDEKLHPQFYLGTGIILGSVIVYEVWLRVMKRRAIRNLG